MMSKSHSFSALSFPKPSLNGFIHNVEKQLQTFHHEEIRTIKKAYLYAGFLGMFGAHHFYLGRLGMGCMYLCTFGLFGVGYVVDLFRIPSLVKKANKRIQGEETKRTLFESYLLWFPCGILGFHYFYLKEYTMAVLYLFSGGIYGIGWLLDAVRIPQLVASVNGETYIDHDEISLAHAYLFALPPFGLLGAHHYYCRRRQWGLFYTFTFAGLGIGWLLDFIRMPFIVSRTEDKLSGKSQVTYHKDDVYMLWMSFGLLGAHHFYLRRYRWGLIYLCTLGVLGVGWIADLFRLPKIINELNSEIEQQREIANVIALAENRVFSLPLDHDDHPSLPFDDVMHHHPHNSPRVVPKLTKQLINEAFEGSPRSPRHAGSLGQRPQKRQAVDPDSPMFCLRRTLTTESNAIHTISVGNSPAEDRKHGMRQQARESPGVKTVETKPENQIHSSGQIIQSTFSEFDSSVQINGQVIMEQSSNTGTGRRRRKHPQYKVEVDVHVHNTHTGESSKKDRQSSVSLGQTIQSDDVDDTNSAKRSIASVDINRTPTIRVKDSEPTYSKSWSNSVTSHDRITAGEKSSADNTRNSMRKSVASQRRKRKTKRENNITSQTVALDSPRDYKGLYEIESPRPNLFPGADPLNALQNEYDT